MQRFSQSQGAIVDRVAFTNELSVLLAPFLAAQRWYLPVADPVLRVRRVDTLRDGWPSMLWVVAEVRPDGGQGRPILYQLVLGATDEEPVELPPVCRLGSMPTPRGDAWLFDALSDEELALDLVRNVDPEGTFASVRAISGSHANSSLVVDESWVLKLYRRIADGPNPDVEVTEALGAVGYGNVSVPVKVWRKGRADLAVLRRMERSRGVGADLALDSLREVFNLRRPPRECRLDFADEAESLGAEVARLHVALGEALGVHQADGSAWAADMVAQLHRVTDGQVDTARVEEVYQRLSMADDLGMAIRVHGDLRLDKALRVRRSWMLFDFEGEPGRLVAERRRASSPLRDVAGMTRSFHQVATVALAEAEYPDGELRLLADAWAERSLNSFLSGYTSEDEVHRLLPQARVSRDALLSVFELDAAVHEVAYELSHHPEVAERPRQAVQRLLDEDDGAGPKPI
ncbi:MAG: maltokinase N-terminal cap-like domain-containing protein [Microthrixaceae bacterium]